VVKRQGDVCFYTSSDGRLCHQHRILNGGVSMLLWRLSPDIQYPRQTTARRISRPVCVLAARLGERRFPTASSAPSGACDVGSSTGRLYNGYQFLLIY